MKTSHTIFVIALTAATLSTGAFTASAAADRTSDNTNWLTIPIIYNKVTAAGYKDIHQIERERRGYDIEAYDSNGNRVELFVDPINGEVLDVHIKKDKSDKYHD